MEKRKTTNRFSPEVRERAVRMVLEHGKEHASQWEAIGSIAPKIGCTVETLRGWVRQAERDRGVRPGPTSAEQERIKADLPRPADRSINVSRACGSASAA